MTQPGRQLPILLGAFTLGVLLAGPQVFAQESQSDTTSVETAPTEPSPTQTAPTETEPIQAAPKEVAPTTETPKETVPTEATPKVTIPTKATTLANFWPTSLASSCSLSTQLSDCRWHLPAVLWAL